MHQLALNAIQAALHGDWENAIDFNLSLLREDPDNLTALNRLARAYTEIGQKEAAKTTYLRVLELDQYNPIALKNLKLLPGKKLAPYSAVSCESFVEEPGVTKTTHLIKLAGKDVLLSLVHKQPVLLHPRARLVAIETEEHHYLGCLPDDLSLKLLRLVKQGYIYSACLKAITDNSLAVFIREIKRPKRITAAPSFSRHQPLHV